MGNEARRRVQVLSSHDVEEFRKFLAEKANEAVPPPNSYMICGIVRAVFPQLCELRRKGYSLNMLVRMLDENDVRITSTALSGYMTKLSRQVDEAPAVTVRKGKSQPSTNASAAKGHLAIKPDVHCKKGRSVIE